MRISLPRGPSLGLGLSLLVHAAVLAWLVHLAPFSPAPDAPPVRMQVTLLRLPPPRPAVEPTPTPAPPPASTRASPAPAAPRTRARPMARAIQAAPDRPASAAAEPAPIIALPPDGAAPTQAQAQSAPEQAGAPGFEMQAARGTARAWVKGEGRGRGGADGLGTPMRPTRSEQLGQALERARRADCRGAYAGLGLLAVIPLAKDAVTGTGCKW
jgi:hypothetical protein